MIFVSSFLAVQASFWPVLLSLAIFSSLANMVLFISGKISFIVVLAAFKFLCLVSFLWWKDFMRESIVGFHTHKLEICLRSSMLLFILSEVFFFISFFWAFYDASLSPVVELGLIWPPKGVVPLSAYSVPLLNTIILLASGVSVTWAHHALMNNFFFKSCFSLLVTVLLGFYFLYMQYLEYYEAQFSISDGVYGSVFFMATGFHGFHVFIGASMLTYVLTSLFRGFLLCNHHFSFEAAAWYWHFVDVVWLFLFLSVYLWGGLIGVSV